MALPALPIRLTDGMAHLAEVPGSIEDVARLFAGRPRWQADGLCREHPGVSFFPELGQSTAPAKAICGACLVRSECLAFALGLSQSPAGIWGGLSPQERAKLRRLAA